MFERYTEKARRVIFFARYEASQFGTPEIQSEHLLLGILRESKALKEILGLTHVEDIRLQIEGVSERREKIATSVDLPLTTECKRILAYAAEEAERLVQKHIGVEHLLLGILREEKSLGAKVLHKQGVKLEQARKRIADAKDQLAAAASAPPPFLRPPAEEVPPTRRSPVIQVAVTWNSEILLAYRSHFGPPRIGEAILIRSADGAHQTYRVEDIVWELGLDEAIVLKEVNVRVVPEKAL